MKIEFTRRRLFEAVSSRMRRAERKLLARSLRNNCTPAEKLLWKQIRNWEREKGRFLRQKTIRYLDVSGLEGFFIADFYCPKFKLVIELDGGVHLDQVERDMARDEILRQRGMKVIRFWNEEVFRDMASVLTRIRSCMH